MRYFIFILLTTPFLAVGQSGPATGQTIKTPTKTYYNYYDQNGNPYYPGGTQPNQGRPYRSGTKIMYDNNNYNNNGYNNYNNSSYNNYNNSNSGYNNYNNTYGQPSSVTGPPGQGRPYREGNKIIYR